MEFTLLQGIPGLVHGVFLRHGGVSKDSFTSLNAIRGADDEVSVIENRRRIADAVQLGELISCRQVHGDEIRNVVKGDGEIPNCDGLITREIDCGLLALHADCQAALFYDPVKKVVGSLHAGWRGQVQNIYHKMVDRMTSIYGTSPKDLLVCISPSLGPENSEFVHYRTEFPDSFWKHQVKPCYFNLWEISREQLHDAGVLPHHIEIAEIDTFAHPEDLFSYRREKKLGRIEKITEDMAL